MQIKTDSGWHKLPIVYSDVEGLDAPSTFEVACDPSHPANAAATAASNDRTLALLRMEPGAPEVSCRVEVFDFPVLAADRMTTIKMTVVPADTTA